MFELTKADYAELVIKYHHALNVAKAEVENIIDDIEREAGRPVIHDFKARLKKLDSLIEKCERKKILPEDVEDIAGVKVVCLFEDDVIAFSKIIDDAFFVKSEDNYIRCPKDNGYRGIHKTVVIETTVNQKRTRVCVEIQIKTALMDALWDMEHVVKYKKKRPAPTAQEIVKSSADKLDELDKNMITFRDYEED